MNYPLDRIYEQKKGNLIFSQKCKASFRMNSIPDYAMTQALDIDVQRMKIKKREMRQKMDKIAEKQK